MGPKLITEPSPLEVSQLSEDTRANVVPRRNARGGRGAGHLVGALRCMYNHAVADGFLPEADNPAARRGAGAHPGRPRSRALPIRLHEKAGTERWQPVSPALTAHLLAPADSRGGLDSGERLLRYATGKGAGCATCSGRGERACRSRSGSAPSRYSRWPRLT